MNWLRRLLQKSRAEQQLDKELRFHLEQQIASYIAAGTSPEEARRRANLEFGGLERVKEEVRDTHWETHLDNLFRDIRYAFRNARKDRRFTLAAVFALALGIGASTAVFSIFYNLLFNSLAAKDASRLVVPVMQDGSRVYRKLSDISPIRDQNQTFENVIGYTNGFALVRDGLQTYQLYSSTVTADAFEFYGVPPLLGRAILPEDGVPGASPVFVIGYKTWKGMFNADPKVLGKSYTVNGEPRTLVGVMPQRFQAFGFQAQVWIPITWTPSMPRTDQEPDVALLTRVKPGVPLETASAGLTVVFSRLAALHPTDFPEHFAVRGMWADDFLMAGAGAVYQSKIKLKGILYGLLAAVLTLLLITCGNVANLLLARATVREREMAVRSVLGATRGRIIRQLLIESSVLAAAACFVGCAFAWFGLKGADALIHQKAWAAIAGEVTVELNSPVLLFALGLALLTTLVSGLAPALHVARGDLQPHLVGSGKGVGANFSHGKLRAGLIIGEVALSIVLLIGAGLMIRSFLLIKHVDMGFDPKNVVVLYFGHGPNPSTAKATSQREEITRREVMERLKTLPGVAEVTLQDALPGYNGGWPSEFNVAGGTHAEPGSLDGSDENLFQTLAFHLIRGSWLSREQVQGAQHVTVINQRLARDLFGQRNPVGQKIEVKTLKSSIHPPMETSFEIVGVVGDVKNLGPQQPAMPMAFIPNTINGSFMVLLKTTVEPASLVHTIEEQVWAVDPDEIVGICDPLEDFLQQHTYASPQFSVVISTPLAGIGLLLVIIGIFSVTAYTVSLQTHEIGIRTALGAQQASILKLILAKGASLLAVGIVIGLLASYGLTRFLASQIWGVSVTDPWTFAAVVTIVVSVGLFACFVPAHRATQVDPLVALRYE
jgi:putative ABC transport system permease protein